MSNLKDSEKQQINKGLYTGLLIVYALINVLMLGYYLYQGSQRGFENVIGLKNDFLSVAKFSFLCAFLPLMYMKYRDKKSDASREK